MLIHNEGNHNTIWEVQVKCIELLLEGIVEHPGLLVNKIYWNTIGCRMNKTLIG
jgi:hypothetical protein